MDHFSKKHCDLSKKDWLNQVVVMKEHPLEGFTLKPEEQLVFMTHQSQDDSPNAKPLYCGFRLRSNYSQSFDKSQIYGVLAEEHQPDWVKNRLNSMPNPSDIPNYDLFAKARPVPFHDANHSKVLAEFENTFLIARLTPKGRVTFATCKLDENNQAGGWWSFEDLESAKEKFATYSRLIPWQNVIKDSQRPVVSKACLLMLEHSKYFSQFDLSVAKKLENLHRDRSDEVEVIGEEEYGLEEDFEESDWER